MTSGEWTKGSHHSKKDNKRALKKMKSFDLTKQYKLFKKTLIKILEIYLALTYLVEM